MFYLQNKVQGQDGQEHDPKHHRNSERDIHRNGGQHKNVQKMASNSSFPGALAGGGNFKPIYFSSVVTWAMAFFKHF